MYTCVYIYIYIYICISNVASALKTATEPDHVSVRADAGPSTAVRFRVFENSAVGTRDGLRIGQFADNFGGVFGACSGTSRDR